MPQNNASKALAEEDPKVATREPYAAKPGAPVPTPRRRPVPHWGVQLRLQVRRRLKHLRDRRERELAALRGKIESDIAVGEEETVRWHDSVKRSDSEAFSLAQSYQQSEYEYYAGTEAPNPGRRVED